MIPRYMDTRIENQCDYQVVSEVPTRVQCKDTESPEARPLYYLSLLHPPDTNRSSENNKSIDSNMAGSVRNPQTVSYSRPLKRPRVLVACQRCKSRRQKVCVNSVGIETSC